MHSDREHYLCSPTESLGKRRWKRGHFARLAPHPLSRQLEWNTRLPCDDISLNKLTKPDGAIFARRRTICRYFAGKNQVRGVRCLYTSSHLVCGEPAVRPVVGVVTPTGKAPPLAVRLAKALPFRRAQVERREALAAHNDLHTADGAHAHARVAVVSSHTARPG